MNNNPIYAIIPYSLVLLSASTLSLFFGHLVPVAPAFHHKGPLGGTLWQRLSVVTARRALLALAVLDGLQGLAETPHQALFAGVVVDAWHGEAE